MPDLISSSWLQELATSLVVSLVLFSGGFLLGKWRGRRSMRGRNLEQYDFYPFTVDADGFPQFSPQHFERGVKHLLRHSDATAACQMMLIGEQNGVRYQLGADGLAGYEKLHARYGGQRVLQDNSEFLENYRRIVRLLGATFRGMGIEILLHDLVNPSRSIYIRDHVLASEEATRAFFRRYCATEMRVDENILSLPEYEKALAGKRHWQDETGVLASPLG